MRLSNKSLRLIFLLNAIVALIGFVIQFIINLFDLVPVEDLYPTLLGGHEPGLAGAVGRLTDSFSYFTIWSNLVVAGVMFAMYRNPERNSFRFRVLRLDSVLMITITGAVYHILIAPYFPPISWNVYSDIFLHTITPILTVIIWLLFGPRNQVNIKVVFASLVIPIIWLSYTLIRGEIINRYPYDFLDVLTNGYEPVLIMIMILLAVGLFVALVYLALDKLLKSKV
jgi:hypothetical protein